MNNSKLAIDSIPLTIEIHQPNTEYLQKREGELVKIIDALQGIASSQELSSLKDLVFDSKVSTLERDISTEARKERPDVLRLNRLTGELKWAERYCDLTKLSDSYRVELSNVRKQLHGKTQENS